MRARWAGPALMAAIGAAVLVAVPLSGLSRVGPTGIAALTVLAVGPTLGLFLLAWQAERAATVTAGTLEALRATARRLAAGDLHARVDLAPTDPLADVGASIDQMATRVQGLIGARDDLLAAVSHELRTPLARMRFAIDMLADADDPDEHRRRADAMQDDVEELERTVKDLLKFAALHDGAGAVQRRPVDLAALLSELVDKGQRLVPAKAVTAELVPVELRGDPKLLRRAFSNLVSNGCRYTASRLQLVSVREGPEVVVRVDDDGPGVPEADRERIFEPLVRLDAARSRDTGGVGLGLALTRRIVDAHGGSVRCTTSPLGGARFEVRLPVA